MSDQHSIDPQPRPEVSPELARQLEWAWAAGFYDGEGCTHRQASDNGRTRNVYLRMTISQVELTPLERFRRAVGGEGSLTIKKNRKRHPNWRPVHILHLSGPAAKKALEGMWPYLSEPKRQQALAVLREGKFGLGRGQNNAQKTTCKYGHPFSGDNLIFRKRGGRWCKICRQAAYEKYAAKS